MKEGLQIHLNILNVTAEITDSDPVFETSTVVAPSQSGVLHYAF